MVLQAFIVRIFAVVVLTLAVFVVSWPALSGQFWLDDFGVLPPLFEQQKYLGTLYSISTGQTGPLGRPLSLLSFALQVDSWPKAHDFILVNIIIHSLNVLMVFCLLLKLLTDQSARFFRQSSKLKILALAFSVSLFWALSPVLASSVFYVVQRMTLLASFFVLLTLLAYVYSWSLLHKSRLLAILFCVFSCGTLSVLGLLAKESALLLLVYALCLHLALDKGAKANTDFFFNKVAPAGLAFAVAIVLVYIVYMLQTSYIKMYDSRDFGLAERLLSQARILWVYLAQTVLPRPSELGLFHDDYEISKGLLSPISTLYSVGAWLLVIALSLYFFLKKKNPIPLFALSWYLGGHSLEGSVIPLELYFEHRNYLPAVAVYLFVAFVLLSLYRVVESRLIKTVFVSLLAVYSLLFFGISYYASNLWGDPNRLSLIYAEERPGSIRARALKVSVLQIINEPELAIREIESIQRDFPNELAPYLTEIEMRCAYGAPGGDELVAGLPIIVEKATYSVSALKSTMDLIEQRQEGGGCEWFDYKDIESLLLLILSNPEFESKRDMTKSFLALVTDLKGDSKQSLLWLRAIEKKSFQTDLREILILLKLQELRRAQELLEELKMKENYGLEFVSQRAYLDQLSLAIANDIQERKKKGQ